MKEFNYNWNDELFLLHVQINNPEQKDGNILVKQHFSSNEKKEENIFIGKDIQSYRFIISRSHPSETAVSINYNKEHVMEVFEIYDRAYYPTEAMFVR